ncbi:MAG TPA: hypothetical protein VFS02_25695 [Telluria sp.]|nr:hypothetical protein [Telluria sp.]
MNHPAPPDVLRDIDRVNPERVARAAQFPSSILAHVARRRGALSGRTAALLPLALLSIASITTVLHPSNSARRNALDATAKATV